MTTANDQALLELIQNSPILLDFEKAYLAEKIPVLGPLDKLKSKKALMANMTPEVILKFRKTRQEFVEAEKAESEAQAKAAANKQGFFAATPKPKEILAHSILANSGIIGTPSPRPPQVPPQPISSLEGVASLNQLNSLTPQHVNFGVGLNGGQTVRKFLEVVGGEFDKIPDPFQKRNYFALFLASPLFRAYLNTGLTALKHQEIKPRNTVLNTMQRIDPRFLNRTQFEYAAEISSGLRSFIGL